MVSFMAAVYLNLLFTSSQTDGVQIWDIMDRVAPVFGEPTSRRDSLYFRKQSPASPMALWALFGTPAEIPFRGSDNREYSANSNNPNAIGFEAAGPWGEVAIRRAQSWGIAAPIPAAQLWD